MKWENWLKLLSKMPSLYFLLVIRLHLAGGWIYNVFDGMPIKMAHCKQKIQKTNLKDICVLGCMATNQN
jgi:hypothetical protein